jgi:hypothetical protein
MQHDKKVVGGRVIGVWPVKMGEVVIRPIERQVCEEWFQSKHRRRKKPQSARQQGTLTIRRKATARR